MLFLNNAINHGVLTPLGIQEAAEKGKSVLFLLEANPGPGLGLLLAYTFFGRGLAKASAPGAAIIQFFGGIHEVYFPYVLMKPKLILATIAGGMTGIFLYVAVRRRPARPGGARLDLRGLRADAQRRLPRHHASVSSAPPLVSFLVGALLLKLDRSSDDGDLDARHRADGGHEGQEVDRVLGARRLGCRAATARSRTIVFACDAGMGSSAMGASVLRKKIQAAGLRRRHGRQQVDLQPRPTTTTSWSPTRTSPTGPGRRPPSAIHVSVDNFMGSPRYDEIVELVRRSATAPAARPVRGRGADEAASERRARRAVDRPRRHRHDPRRGHHRGRRAAGRRPAPSTPSYVDAMHEREKSVSTAHGQRARDPARHQRGQVGDPAHRRSRSCATPSGIDWNGKPAEFVVGIAGAGDDHLALLSRIAEIFVDQDAGRPRSAPRTTPEDVLAVLDGVRV